eukprot:SAG31_NODE_34478_length_332_cov_1.111588_1_plen_100_part_01
MSSGKGVQIAMGLWGSHLANKRQPRQECTAAAMAARAAQLRASDGLCDGHGDGARNIVVAAPSAPALVSSNPIHPSRPAAAASDTSTGADPARLERVSTQ